MNELLKSLYKTPTRYYHTFEHATTVDKACLKYCSDIGSIWADDAMNLSIAALWHDVVYIVGSKTNEIDSANLLLEYYPEYTTSANLIQHTTIEDHLSDDITWEADKLQSILLDSDVMSLADSYDMFLINQLNIAKEHGLSEITPHHAKFLTKFLDKKQIFRCPMSKYIECSARTNIETLAKSFDIL